MELEQWKIWPKQTLFSLDNNVHDHNDDARVLSSQTAQQQLQNG